MHEPEGSRPTLVVNPTNDWRLALLASDSATLGAGPEILQEALRHDYPNLVVRRRELSGETVEIWYVYREGHWVPPDPPSPDASRLWEPIDAER